MKEGLMYDGITEIREDIIERAECYVFPGETENGKIRKNGFMKCLKANPVWVTATVAAACLLLVFVTPFLYIAMRKCGSEGPPEAADPGASQHGSANPGKNQNMPGNVTPALAPAYKDVSIYYVNGAELACETEYLEADPQLVFVSWKEKNGIGEEVLLLDFEIQSNATVNIKDGMAEHVPGDYHRLYLTVSKNLKTYYEAVDSELLLESLEQTMTGYSGLTYQEYHLILE